MSQRPVTATSTSPSTRLPDDRDASGRSFGPEDHEAVRPELERGAVERAVVPVGPPPSVTA